MSILQKVKINSNERLDLTDFNKLDSFICADYNLFFKHIVTPGNYVVKGFRVFQDSALTNSLPTISPIYVEIANSSVVRTTTTDSWFVGASGTSPAQITLFSNATNYIELDLSLVDGSPDIRSFWDPTANGGAGGEFSQTVNTVTNLTAVISVSTSGFSGGNKVPIAEISVNSGGAITTIYDRRNMLFRVEKNQPFNNNNTFPYVNRDEGRHTLTVTSQVGTFLTGETITFGTSGMTAVVVTNSPLVVKSKTAGTTVGKFTIGETLTGGTSAATAVLATAKEDFNSGDKAITTIKDWTDAVETEILRMKWGTSPGPRFWYEDANTFISANRIEYFMNSAGYFIWTTPTLSWSASITIPILGTTFVNTINAGGVNLTADGMVAYITINRSANATLTVNTVAQTGYVATTDRYIIARRDNGMAIIYSELR